MFIIIEGVPFLRMMLVINREFQDWLGSFLISHITRFIFRKEEEKKKESLEISEHFSQYFEKITQPGHSRSPPSVLLEWINLQLLNTGAEGHSAEGSHNSMLPRLNSPIAPAHRDGTWNSTVAKLDATVFPANKIAFGQFPLLITQLQHPEADLHLLCSPN